MLKKLVVVGYSQDEGCVIVENEDMCKSKRAMIDINHAIIDNNAAQDRLSLLDKQLCGVLHLD